MRKENQNYMTDHEFEQFLQSIGGLKNGYFVDRPVILTPNCGVGNGWFGIVKRLIEDLIELGWNREICQIKEKFGGLRFYINEGSEDIFNRIRLAEDASYLTCEVCGEPGTLRAGHWHATMCDEHSDGNLPLEIDQHLNKII